VLAETSRDISSSPSGPAAISSPTPAGGAGEVRCVGGEGWEAMTRSRRALLVRIGLLLCAALATLAAIELGLRANGYDPVRYGEEQELAIQASASKTLVYELRPGAQGQLWGREVHVNSAGFRDREFETAKPEGWKRIVAIGDSITFGTRLDLKVTWPKRLEQMLRGKGKKVEVLNLGVGGYDTAQEIECLERIGLAFDPDYVVLGFCVNDVATVSLNLPAIWRAEQLDNWLGWSRLVEFLRARRDKESLVREMAEVRAAEEVQDVPMRDDPVLEAMRLELAALIETAQEVPNPDALSTLERLGWYTSEARLARLTSRFEHLSRLAAENGFAVGFFVVPYLDEQPDEGLTRAWQLVYDMIHHEAERVGFDVVEVYDALAEEGLSRLRRQKQDPIHPNQRGHFLMARQVFKQIVRLPGF
jgi:lysophospholipase L1-like esterase